MITTSNKSAQEQQFMLSFENAAVGLAHLSQQGYFLVVNNKLCEITGYSREELLGRTFQEITHPDDLESDLIQAQALFRGEIPSYSMEKRYIRKDGSFVWIKLTGSAVFDESGAFNMFVAVIEDISEKKAIENALHERQGHLNNILSSITECYVVLDKNWQVLEINEVAEREIFRRPAAEVIGNNVWDLYPQNRGDAFNKELEKAFRENVPIHFEAYSNVTDKWLEVHAYPRENKLEVFFRDITSRKNLEVELRKSEDKFSKLFFNSPAFMVITDIESGKFIEANETFCRLIGYSREELIGKTSIELGIISNELRDKVVKGIIKNDKIEFIELELTNRNGVKHPVLYSAQKIRLNGETYSITSGFDITQAKKAEEGRRESEARFKMAATAAKIGAFDRNYKTSENYWSPEFLALFGLKPNNPLPMKDGIPLAVHPDDRERVLAEARNHYNRTGDPEFNSEHRIILPDGSIRWLNIAGHTGFDENNIPLHTYGVAIDITERKQAEEALRESEKKFRSVFEQAAVGIGRVRFDDACWIDVNDAFCQMLGYAQDELLAIPWPQITHPDDVDLDLIPFKKMAAGELESYTVEKRFIHKEGHYIWARLTLSLVRNEQGAPDYEIAVIENITKKKQAEEALRQKIEENEKLMDILPAAVFISNDPRCDHMTGNRMANEFYETNEDENLSANATCSRRFFKDGVELKPEELPMQQCVLNNRKVFNETLEVLLSNGKKLHMHGSAIPLYDNQGNVRGSVAAFIDLTKKIQTEQALRESENRFRMVLENSRDGIHLMDLIEKRYVFMSPAQEELTGFSLEELNFSMNEAAARLHPDDVNSVDVYLDSVIKGNTPSEPMEYRWKVKSGEYRWFSDSRKAVRDSKGKVIALVGTSRDITRQKAIQTALLESEEKFRMLANNISQLAWMMDKDGWVFWFNQRWYDYTGTTFEDMQGWGWQKVHHPDHIERVLKSKKQSIEAGKVWEELFPLRSKEGQYRWYLTRAVPVKDEKGNIIRWLGTNTDVTNQRKYEAQLEKDNKLFVTLFAIAAHDLKSPVANMHGALNLMKGLSSEKKLMFLDRFHELADQLSDTISGLTEILQVRNIGSSATSDINIPELCEKILSEFKNEVKQSSVKLNFEKQTIHYIQSFLHSIIKNLISNAIKYCRNEVALSIEISTKKAGNYTLLTVQDNGIGIDLNQFGGKLFKPFERLANKKVKGTGIGLFLIKDVIEKNDGYIDVESTPGAGTTFYCYLKEYK